MPEVVHGPELIALNTGLSASQTAALLSLFAALPGPADRPALGRLVRAAAASCSAVRELQAAAAQARGVRARRPLINGWKKWLRDEINWIGSRASAGRRQ